MKLLGARLISALALLLLVACTFDLPNVASAVVEHGSSGNATTTAELSSSQTQALSGWFAQHSSGWSSSVASYLPTLVVRVKHTNGEVSVINVLANSVVVNNSSGQFTQQFPEPDLIALRALLDAR